MGMRWTSTPISRREMSWKSCWRDRMPHKRVSVSFSNMKVLYLNCIQLFELMNSPRLIFNVVEPSLDNVQWVSGSSLIWTWMLIILLTTTLRIRTWKWYCFWKLKKNTWGLGVHATDIWYAKFEWEIKIFNIFYQFHSYVFDLCIQCNCISTHSILRVSDQYFSGILGH